MLKDILSGNSRNILGINRRNLDYVYPASNRKFFKIADDKLASKELFRKAGVPVPETLLRIDHFSDTLELEEKLQGIKDFVIKPNQGKGGYGIMVLGKSVDGGWESAGGKFVPFRTIKKHIAEILMGVFSLGHYDCAFIERRLFPHRFFAQFYDQGLGDIRLIYYKNRPVMGMVRLPTSLSNGKANLHQGGIGVGLDLEKKETSTAIAGGKPLEVHPDTKIQLGGVKVPHLDKMLQYAADISKHVPLQYIGFDFTLDKKGPLLMEINARPGLEIQNANRKGLLEVL